MTNASDKPVPGLFAYKTDPQYKGAVALDWFDPDPAAEEMSAELWTGFWDTGWHAISPFQNEAGEAHLLRYRREDGLLASASVRRHGDGTDDGELVAPNPDLVGCDRLVSFGDFNLLYRRDNGQAWLIDARKSIDLIAVMTLPAGLDLLIPVCDGLLGYRQEGGEVTLLDGISFGGAQTLWQETWPGNWQEGCLLPAPTAGAFLYDPNSGQWELRALAGEGPQQCASGNWRAGWTTLLPFEMSGWSHVLGYENQSGDVEILRFHAESEQEVVWRFRWSAGWSIQVPLYWDGGNLNGGKER